MKKIFLILVPLILLGAGCNNQADLIDKQQKQIDDLTKKIENIQVNPSTTTTIITSSINLAPKTGLQKKESTKQLSNNCISWDYTNWRACINEKQERSWVTAYPTGCTGGNPVLARPCTPTNIQPQNQVGQDYSEAIKTSVNSYINQFKNLKNYVNEAVELPKDRITVINKFITLNNAMINDPILQQDPKLIQLYTLLGKMYDLAIQEANNKIDDYENINVSIDTDYISQFQAYLNKISLPGKVVGITEFNESTKNLKTYDVVWDQILDSITTNIKSWDNIVKNDNDKIRQAWALIDNYTSSYSNYSRPSEFNSYSTPVIQQPVYKPIQCYAQSFSGGLTSINCF